MVLRGPSILALGKLPESVANPRFGSNARNLLRLTADIGISRCKDTIVNKVLSDACVQPSISSYLGTAEPRTGNRVVGVRSL